MKMTRQTKVYSANSQLSAVAVQAALEKAGVPVSVIASSNGTYLDVMVPTEFEFDASNLLFPDRRCGELFWVASK